MTIKFSDITGGGIPYGNTAGRPANPGVGKLYSNGETARLELYTQASGWQNIVQETPGVSSITGTYSEQTNSGTITISGTNFVSGAYASAVGTNGVEIQAASTTYNSLVQLTATFTNLSNAYEPYGIKVTNPSNLFGLIPNALYVNASPVWQTSSGSLGTFIEQVSVSVSATATDSDSTITYSLANGSSLPSGLSLNSSTGAITGTLPDVSTNTTYNFTINASDGVNTIPRAFSITSTAITPTVEYLVVAGGGGGGVWVGSGGGAGGLLTGTLSITSKSIPITVGLGGSGTRDEGGAGSGPYVSGTKGGDSILGTLTAFGGGVGGSYANALAASQSNGGSGGGAMENTGSQFTANGSTLSGGTGTSGQGYPGGYYIASASPTGSQYVGAGGGGAGSAGAWANVTSSAVYSSTERKGGNGVASSITGSSITYAGGGGGGCNSWNGPVPGTSGLQCSDGGAGGGGAGWTFSQAPSNTSGASIDRYNTATNGTNGLGGGGGGVGWSGPNGKHRAGNGGSGAVIIAYPNTYPALSDIPGTLTYDTPTRAGYRVYRFTAGTGTITF